MIMQDKAHGHAYSILLRNAMPGKILDHLSLHGLKLAIPKYPSFLFPGVPEI